ncbi:MAG: hypothetical protein GX293_09330 [Bacteroidales bacterium]|nr:hypothetical protein [Bacteroidales bacterium]
MEDDTSGVSNLPRSVLVTAGRRAQSTERRAQSTGHRAQGTEHRAQGEEEKRRRRDRKTAGPRKTTRIFIDKRYPAYCYSTNILPETILFFEFLRLCSLCKSGR